MIKNIPNVLENNDQRLTIDILADVSENIMNLVQF